MVLSGNSFNTFSHHDGFAAFTWDLIAIHPDLVASNPTGLSGLDNHVTIGALQAATGPGTVTRFEEQGLPFPPPGDPNPVNMLFLEHSPGEISVYIHLQNDSVSEFGITTGSTVNAGQLVARNGDHLHFGVQTALDGLPFVTYPIAFRNYFMSVDYGRSWQFVASGIPLAGQWITRTDPRIPPVEIPAAGCLIARQNLNVRDRNTVTAASFAGSYDAGNDTRVIGSVFVVGNGFLGDRTTVDQDMVLGGALAGNRNGVLGSLVENGGPVPIPALPVRTFSVGAGSQSVANNAVVTLNPGTFGNMIFRAGSRVTLNAGTYNFASLNVEPDVRVTALGTVTVNVQGRLEIGDRAQVQGAAPGNLTLYANGIDQRIGTDVILRALFVAPQASVTVFSRTQITGCLGANVVRFEPDVILNGAGAALPTSF